MTEGTGTHPQRLVIHYLFAIFLVVLSYLFFTSMDAYVIDGEQLLVNRDFSDDMSGWLIRGSRERIQASEGIVTIRHEVKSKSNSLSQCWDSEIFTDQILLGITTSTTDLEPGEKPWHQARVGLIGYFPDGKKDYRLSSSLVALYQDQPWKAYQQGFNIDAALERICMTITLQGSKGVFQFKEPLVYPARIPTEYSLIKSLSLVIWLFAGAYWLTLLVKHYRGKIQIVFLTLMVVVIAVGVLMPIGLKALLTNWLSTYVPAFLTAAILNDMGLSLQFWTDLLPQRWDASKFGHLLGFFLMSATLFSEKEKSVWTLLPGLVLLALVSEVLQHYVPGRGPSLSDVLVDLIGIIAGWWLIRGYFKLRQTATGS
jgi:VanZ family protein